MRYRIQIQRIQTAERVITARDEDHAHAKIAAELDKPYGMLASWTTVDIQVEIVSAESTVPGASAFALDGGALLLSVAEAAKQLGISRGRFYELVNCGEIDSVSIGRRRLISRDALAKFVETNTTAGYRD
jgi:excisionase family DNA binding protein